MLTYRTAWAGFDRRVWMFLAVWGLVAFAYFGVLGVLLNLYLLRLGFGVEFIGLLIGSGQLIWGAAAFPSAVIGPRLGLRRALILALAISALGAALIVLVEALPQALQPIWLILSWGLLWVGGSLNTVSSLPYLAAITRSEHRNYAFAARQTTIALLTIAGSLIAGALPIAIARQIDTSAADPAPYRIALMLVPLCFAAASLLMLLTPPMPAVAKPALARPKSAMPLGLLAAFGLVAVLETASEGPVRAFFNVHMSMTHALPTNQIGLIMGIAQLIAVGGTLLAPRLTGRWGSAPVLTGVVCGVGAALLMLGIAGSVAGSALAYALLVLAAAMVATTRAPFSQEIVAEEQRPKTSAILTLAVALGWGVTAIAGGFATRSLGFNGVFIISATLAFASAALTYAFFVRRSSRGVAVNVAP